MTTRYRMVYFLLYLERCVGFPEITPFCLIVGELWWSLGEFWQWTSIELLGMCLFLNGFNVNCWLWWYLLHHCFGTHVSNQFFIDWPCKYTYLLLKEHSLTHLWIGNWFNSSGSLHIMYSWNHWTFWFKTQVWWCLQTWQSSKVKRNLMFYVHMPWWCPY